MAVAFSPGQTIGRGDLDIFLTNMAGNPTNASDIYYALVYVDPGPPEAEVPIGDPHRIPVNPTIGEYYAALMVPPSANAGTYRIRWTFKEFVNSPYQQVVQEFAVVASSNLIAPSYSSGTQQMIDSLRMLLRDQNPSKFYHFRPPEFEGNIGQYNRVFGQIWEDAELVEYCERGLDWWNAMPPFTGGNTPTLDRLVTDMPAWRTAVLWAAISHACFALAANWVADEFSLHAAEQVRVLLPDGRWIDVPIGELYNIVHGDK